MTFEEVFNGHIKGRTVVSSYVGRPLANMLGDKIEPYYTHIKGLTFDNGWTYAHHGVGCSGEDCNSSYIISPENKVIVQEEW